MEKWNIKLFLALNAPSAPDPWLVFLARVCAEDPVFLIAGLVAALWVWGAPGRRGGLLAMGVGLLLACAISAALNAFWYNPRPFAAGIGHTLIPHAPDSSFPSEHATFLWTVGFGLVATRVWRALGWLVVALGLATAWARLYLGVHFPLDMAGSFVIAGVSAEVAMAVQPWVEARMLSLVERLYEATLDMMRLPIAVFPRHGSRTGR